MISFNNSLSRSFVFSLFTITTASLQAGISVIVSVPPAPREIVVGPPGYTTCYVVQPGFYNGVWHYKQRVCEYEGDSGLRMWVNGYWQCGSYRTGGVCMGWHWIGSHWATRSELGFYRRPSHRDYYRHLAHGHGGEYGQAHGYVHGHGHGYRDGYRHGR
jgi:hypothetical protein